MTEQEFKKYWQENKQRILENMPEYQRVQDSYRMKSGIDWLWFLLPAISGIAAMHYFTFKHEILTWVVSALVTIVCFFLCVWIKSLLSGTRSLHDIEQEAKEKHHQDLVSDNEHPFSDAKQSHRQ